MNKVEQAKNRNFYTVKEARELVYDNCISITMMHKLINSKKIPALRLCKRLLIPAAWVEREIEKGHVI